MLRKLGLAAGPLAFLELANAPMELEGPARLTAAVALLMAVWWRTRPGTALDTANR
ncbi:MAG: hypothetical protein VB852_05845 [Deltaproteobacteria bacterium]